MRLTIFLSLLYLCLLSGCTTDEPTNSPDAENTEAVIVKEPLLTNIDFRVENYNVDTLANYEASPEFFDKYIKGYDAFRINYDNPLVNAAVFHYYVLDTLVNSDIKVLIILEHASTKIVGSRLIALILNDNWTIKTARVLALTEENDAWDYYWRSYIINDTLHTLVTGMGDSDTMRTKFHLNGFKDIEPIATER